MPFTLHYYASKMAPHLPQVILKTVVLRLGHACTSGNVRAFRPECGGRQESGTVELVLVGKRREHESCL